MSERTNSLIVVADDVGVHPAVNAGVYLAAAEQAITAADIMVYEPWAHEAVNTLRHDYPEVDLGLHIVAFPEMTSLESSPLIYKYRSSPPFNNPLLPALINQTRFQIRLFQDSFGSSPAHISTHDHAHQTLDWRVYPEFLDVVKSEIGDVDATVVRGHHNCLIRHTRLSLLQANQPPLSPQLFSDQLRQLGVTQPAVETGIHPGVTDFDNRPIDSYFTINYRQQDLVSWLAIHQAGAVALAGFSLRRPSDIVYGQFNNYDMENA